MGKRKTQAAGQKTTLSTVVKKASSPRVQRKAGKVLHADGPGYLPRCTGPKLQPFANTSTLRFVRYISDPEEAYDSHVFEIAVGDQQYALKVFNIYHRDKGDRWERMFRQHPERFPSNEGLLTTHRDPFDRECRAYGAIIDHGLNGIVTPECFGHITLNTSQESELQERFNLAPSDWRRCRDQDWQPLRAIVKELMSDGPSFSEVQIPQMLQDLRTLHQIGVFPYDDVADRNYRFGRLFDFSRSLTKPHFMLSYGLLHRREVLLEESADLRAFDHMISESGFKTTVRAAAHNSYLYKLRDGGVSTYYR